MKVTYREDRKRWGFSASVHGKRQKLYRWLTKDDAEKALEEYERKAKLPRTALSVAAADYLKSSEMIRSGSRCDGLRHNFDAWILPFFGPERPIADITSDDVEQFIAYHKQRELKPGRRVSNMTIWHYIKDLNALLNWCVKKSRLDVNPVSKADRSPIRNRHKIKLPLDVESMDRGFETLRDRERLYIDTLRFMGLRMDEGNHVQAKDVLIRSGTLWLSINYHQTDIKANRVIPIPPVLQESYRHYIREAQPTDYILCSNPKERSYSRRRLMERISKAAGIHITAKDLRDYFASIMDDPVIASQMLGHTNLRTTAIYICQVQRRMRSAVETLGMAIKPVLPEALEPGIPAWRTLSELGGHSGGHSAEKDLENSSKTAVSQNADTANPAKLLIGA